MSLAQSTQGAWVQNIVDPSLVSVLCATFAIAFVSACRTSAFVLSSPSTSISQVFSQSVGMPL